MDQEQVSENVDNNAASPNFKDPWLGYAACDSSENGIYVFSVFSHEPVELWKYNFSTKEWLRKNLPDSTKIIRMIILEQGDLLFLSCSGTYPNVMYQLIRYDPANESCNTVATLPLKEDTFDTNLFFEKDGKIFISLAYQESNKLMTFDMNTNDWEELCDLPRDFADDRMSGVLNENKFYLFCSSDWPTDWPDNVYVFDFGTCQLEKVATIKDETHQWPSDMGMYLVTKFEDCAYFFGIFDGFEGNEPPSALAKNNDKKIHRLHLPSLTWSELPNNLPNSKLLFMPVFTKDGQLHLFYENGLLKINLSKQTRLLQKICWDFIVDYLRCKPFSAFTDDVLLKSGIQKKFISKLRW